MTLVALVDTNVVVSGVLAAAEESPAARILDAMTAGTLHFILSDDLLAEYRAVLLRPVLVARHGLSAAEVDEILADIVVNAGWREPAEAGDEHVIALLEAEPQATLVTGDRRLREAVGAVRAARAPAELAAELSADASSER